MESINPVDINILKEMEWMEDRKILNILSTHQFLLEELGRHINQLEKEVKLWKENNMK
jgi:hypothetical protein